MQKFFLNVDSPAVVAGQGVKRKVIAHSKELMTCEIDYQKGGVGLPHKHEHSQCSYAISGVYEYMIEGEKQILKAGDSAYVPPNAMHGCVCLEKGKLLDIFTPEREDFLS